jgi:hypothetical protein
MKDNYLVVFCSHVDSQSKKETVINTLEEFKKEGLDVCFSTHSPEYLDEISSYVKYVVYDNNNQFILKNDYLLNSDLIDSDYFKYGVSAYKRYETFGTVIELNPGSPHSKSALSLLKNGVSISRLNNYKWTIYLEYDIKKPVLGYKNFFDSQIKLLENSDKKCFHYNNSNNFQFLWGGFFLFDTERVFNNDLLMNTDWYSSSRSWIKTFKLGFFESVVESILKNSFFAEEISNKLISEDSLRIWGIEKYIDLQKYHYEETFYNGEYDLKKFFNINLYPAIKGDKTFLVLFAHNLNGNTGVRVDNLQVKSLSQILISKNNLEVPINGWYYERIDVTNFFENDIIKLNCRCDNGVDFFNVSEEIKVKHIKNIHDNLLRIEFI